MKVILCIETSTYLFWKTYLTDTLEQKATVFMNTTTVLGFHGHFIIMESLNDKHLEFVFTLM